MKVEVYCFHEFSIYCNKTGYMYIFFSLPPSLSLPCEVDCAIFLSISFSLFRPFICPIPSICDGSRVLEGVVQMVDPLRDPPLGRIRDADQVEGLLGQYFHY